MDAIRFTLLFLTLLTIFANFDQFSVVSAVDVDVEVEEPVGNNVQVVDSDQGASSNSSATLVMDDKNYECCDHIDQPFDVQLGTVSNSLRNRFAPTIQAVEPVQIADDDSESTVDSCPICLDDLKPVDLAACEALSNKQVPSFSLRRLVSFLQHYTKLLAACEALSNRQVPSFTLRRLRNLWELYSKYNAGNDDEEETVYFHLPSSHNATNGGSVAPYSIMAKHRAHKKCVRSLINSSFPSVLELKCPMCKTTCDCKDLCRQDVHFPSRFEIDQMVLLPKRLQSAYEYVVLSGILLIVAAVNDLLVPIVENVWTRATLLCIMGLVLRLAIKLIHERN